MTLEQLVMYLWHDMPITGWIAVLAFMSMLGGLAIYFEGNGVMRANSLVTTSTAAYPDGSVAVSKSYSVGNSYDFGRRTSWRGLIIVAFSLAALIILTYF